MAKTFASRLPLREKKLNVMLSINYLNLISLFLALIYGVPYLTTEFHRAPEVVRAPADKRKQLRHGSSTKSPQFWSICIWQRQPHHRPIAGYILPLRTFVNGKLTPYLYKV